MNDSSQLNLNGTYTGNLTLYHTSSVTVNGLLDGELLLQGTAMSTIGVTGTVNGDVKVSDGDQLTVAGSIANGVFYVNQTGVAVIEPTAKIYSDSAESWLYNDADVTWNVGADGSVGMLWTTRSESSAGAYDGEWRYDGSTNLTVVLDAYDVATHGEELTVRLVSNIQSESTFADNVTFLLNGAEVSTFAYTGNGTFVGTVEDSGTVVPPYLSSGITEDGDLVLGWSGTNGVTYAVQSSTNLVSGVWSNIVTGLSGATISVTNDTSKPQEYFQVVVE